MRPAPKEALDLIHQFEQGPKGGFAAEAYPDAGELAIGWGHRIDHADPLAAQVISEAQADALAEDDLAKAARTVCAILGDEVAEKLSDGQYAALIDFTYNEGSGNFAGSTLCKLVKSGDHQGAAAEFDKWDKSGGRVLTGLDRRRAAEKILWQA